MTETPSHAEREVERARADLRDTLDALKEKLSFGELFDEARHKFMTTDSGEFLRNLGRQARDNPMPAVLAGASLLWLMMSNRERRQTYGTRATRFTGDGMGMRTAAESARETGEGALERAQAAASSAGETMRSMAHTVGDTMTSATGAARSAGHSAAELMHSASEAAQTASRSAVRMGQRTTQSLSEIIEQQPLLLGVAGLALGALVGALLPSTRIEDEYLGETRDQLREAISEQSGQLYEKGKITATEVYRAAAEEARAQGLMPEETSGTTLAERVEQVVTKAGEAAKEATQRELGGGGETEPSRTVRSSDIGTPAGGSQAASGEEAPESIKPGKPVIPERGS